MTSTKGEGSLASNYANTGEGFLSTILVEYRIPLFVVLQCRKHTLVPLNKGYRRGFGFSQVRRRDALVRAFSFTLAFYVKSVGNGMREACL